MVAMSVLGLNWCQHAGWTLALYDAHRKRRLQITMCLEDALVLGQELARRPTERSGLYTTIGTLLRQQPRFASINLALADSSRADVALVVRTDDGRIRCPLSSADGIALAVRAGLPIHADDALLDAFGVPVDGEPLADDEPSDQPAEIPPIFRQALSDPPDDAA